MAGQICIRLPIWCMCVCVLLYANVSLLKAIYRRTNIQRFHRITTTIPGKLRRCVKQIEQNVIVS